MKIAVITNLYGKYARGGAERVAELIADSLAAGGRQVVVITSAPYDAERKLKPEIEVDGGKLIYRFFPLNIFWYKNDFKHNPLVRLVWHIIDMFNLHSVFMVWRIFQKEKPEVALTHNLKGLGFLIPPLIRRLKIKHLHILHDVQLVNPRGIIIKGKEQSLLNNNFLIGWYAAICRKLFASPQVVISPSKWLLEFYKKCGFFKESRKIVLANPIALMDRKINKKNSSGFNFLYLGQLEKHKGILWLVQVFKKLSEKDVNLWIVGGGSASGKAQRLVDGDKRIHFAGPVEQRHLGEIFSKVDVLLAPSLCYENSPSVIYESLSFGVPVVASRIGGSGELIKEGVNGFTFTAGDQEEFLSLLEELTRNRRQVKKMSAAARQSVQDYTIDKYIEKLEKLF